MKPLLIGCLIAAATTAANAQTRPPERVIRDDGALLITDGASYYRFMRDSSFDSGPIGLSGRTITGRWRGDEGEFIVEGRWGWINGQSAIDDYRRMTMRIGGIDGPGTIQSLTLSGVVTSVRVHRAYYIIDGLVPIEPPAGLAREAADRFIRKNHTRSDYELRFERTEDRGEHIWVVYKKIFADRRLENPDSLTVAYTKKTGMTSWVLH